MPELIFDPARRLYQLDGAIVPGVTQILQATRLVDYSFLPDHVRFEALARGRWIADLCALRMSRGPIRPLLLAKLIDEHGAWMRYFAAFERFLAERGDIKPILVERRVFSVQHLFAGTLDFTALMQERPTLFDIKTGTAPKGAAYQTAAYHLALDSLADYEFRTTPHRRFALELHDTGRYQLIEYKRHSHDRQVWLAALTVFNEQERREAA